MNALLIFGFIFVAIYSCVSWLLPTLLSWLFKRKYHIKLKIGRIAVLKLILKDVSLSKDRYFVHIDEISFRSSFFNSEINKLVWVVIKGVEITNKVEEKRSVVVETILKPLLSKQNSLSRSEGGYDVGTNLDSLSADLSRAANQELLDFRDKKLPHSLIMFAQFMGVHIFDASVTIRNSIAPNGSIHVTASEVHADGAAGGPARALVFSANLVDVQARMFKDNHCLGHAGCSLLVEGTVKADGPLNVEKIHAVISSMYVSLEDELYNFLQKHKKHKPASVRPDIISEDHIATIIPRLSPVIPKIFSLKADHTTLGCVDDVTKTIFQMSLQSLQVNSRFSAASVMVDANGAETAGLPQVYVAFQADQYQLTAAGETLASLNKLKLDAKLEKGVLNLYLIISTLNVMYEHSDVFKWYSSLNKRKQLKPLHLREEENKSWSGSSILSRAVSGCVVQGCAEVRGVRILTKLARDKALSFGCAGVKVKLDQLLDTRDEPYQWAMARCVVGRRHWSAELLVDGGWAAPGGAPAPPPPRKQHAWGSALLAVALVKWGSHGPTDSKVEAMMDCLRLEWSTAIAETIITLVDCLNEYRPTKVTQAPPPSPEGVASESADQSPCNIAVNVALSHINLFFIIDENMCLMTRVDAVTLEKTVSKSGAVVSGLKAVDMVPYKGNFLCQRSDEILNSFFHVRLARIEHVPSKERFSSLLDFQFIETVEFEWSANLHLKILTLVRAVKGFRQELREKTASPESSVDTKTKGRASDWRVSFKGETNLGLHLSKENDMLFTTDDMTISYDHEAGLSIIWVQMKMVLNGDEIISVDGYCMERATNDHEVRVERKANEGFVLAWNKVWSVNVDSIRVVFPYKHRFADAVQGDFVSLFKWVKLVHAIKKKPFTAESPLPSDLHIKIQEILIEMSDDPFEVKLRDNYELLEDEYKESQKRRTMLDAKVQELCKPHLFLPAGKVEELYSALRQKDAQIYVQRCRAAPPPRTRLVACCLSGFRLIALADPSIHGAQNAQAKMRDIDFDRLIALADPSIHGAQNAQAKMRDIDFDSPWPEDGMEFTTLWARGVQLGVAQWQLLLRDFPQPLLSCRGLRMWGTVAAAEDQPPPRAVRTVTIDQGAPWGPYELERSMMPLKWYYDLCCEMAQYSYAFGPCWEPVIAHCNLSFDQVSRPSLDPSAPLAWWDKVRLLMHGRLTANIARFTCLLHVSLDPYNTTEEMELTWSDLVLDWTNGKLGFLGELNVFVRTASKYDDCRVLRVPALRLCAKLGWQCVGDPRDHHAQAPCAPTRLPEYSSNQYDDCRVLRVPALRLCAKLGWQCVGDPRDHHAQAPCAPTRLPEYSSNQEHDSYRAFRSQGLDIHLSMETKPIDRDGPVLLLYGSTLRWFESLKLILSGVTRPTRRGRVFNNVRPRKPQLSRHYRNVSVSLTLHNLQVFYWSSSSMQRGIEMLGVRVTCGSKHRLTLVPAADGLLRRPRANWTTVYMNCDLNDAEIWLKTTAAVAEDKDNDANSSVLRPPEVEKWYCVSVRRVSYGREAAGAGAGSATHRLAVHDLRGAWTKLNRDLAFALIDTYIKTQMMTPRSKDARAVDWLLRPPEVEKWYCVSVRRVSYGREAAGAGAGSATHRLAVHDLRGAWTKLNRDLAFALIDTYIKTQTPVLRPPEVEKWYCVSVRRVSYGREAAGAGAGSATHRLAVHDLRGAWTKLNRDLAFALIDTYIKTQMMTPRSKDARAVDWLLRPPEVEKWYCVSVQRVSYGREAAGAGAGSATHRLAVHDLRGAWTKLNRDLAFALIDTYIKTQQLKKNLSTKALKEEEKPNSSPKREADVVSPPPSNAQCQSANTSGAGEGAGGMLAALVAEAGGEAPVVFSDELSGDAPAHPPPHAHHKQLDDDTAHTAFLIELVNSQVVLKGCETRGYVLLCAARAEVRQRVRRSPPATAWCGALSAMQYYATVSAALGDQLDENIQWVSVEEISERWAGTEISTLPDVPRLVGSGHSAGGVIGRTVGPSADTGLAQLQRIVSRCACEFYYASHEEVEQCSSTDAWGASSQPYDSFMLMHHDLDVCTNSLQYAMLLDVVNNVVLHVEPERRRTLERRARMRFQLQLHRDADPRQLIHKLQTQVRESLARLRRLEKEYYLKNRSITGDDPVAFEELKSLDNQVNECKEVVWSLGEELDAMVRAWREAEAPGAGAGGARGPGAAAPHRYNEICFKSARWRLTDADGQLGIADLLLTNFLYTKTSRSDDSVEHQLEVGYVRVTNLLPNEPFPEVLVPQAPSGRAPLARRAALRVFCRDRPPVGGIAVKEHFEVNIVPIRIGLTKKFFNTMLKFCFPERDPESIEDGDDEEGARSGLVPAGSKKAKKKPKDSNSNFYVKRDKKDKDDVEKMKERAEKNKLFIYIKIPEVPVRVSYKGSKEKNLEDVRDLPLVLPTLEYHNVTWTWLDLLLATKSDTRRVILSQAIRQKLQLHRRAAAAPEPHEEDKARLLLGERTVTENKPQKKGTPSVFKFSKS